MNILRSWKKCLSVHTKNVLFTFYKVKRDPLADVLKRFWNSCGHFAMKASHSGAGHRAGDNNKSKLGRKKQWSRFLERAIFIDLMAQTITFYIGQRGFYLTSAGQCHKSCAACTKAERVASVFDWVSSANCPVSWLTLIRHGSLNSSHFREVRATKGHRDEKRWRLFWRVRSWKMQVSF